MTIRFGKCPITGRHGGNSTADGNGYELVNYQGEYMHEITREELKDDEYDIREAERHGQTTNFLRSLGINKS